MGGWVLEDLGELHVNTVLNILQRALLEESSASSLLIELQNEPSRI